MAHNIPFTQKRCLLDNCLYINFRFNYPVQFIRTMMYTSLYILKIYRTCKPRNTILMVNILVYFLIFSIQTYIMYKYRPNPISHCQFTNIIKQKLYQLYQNIYFVWIFIWVMCKLRPTGHMRSGWLSELYAKFHKENNAY